MPIPFDFNSVYGNLKPGMMGSGNNSQYTQNALQNQNNFGMGNSFGGGENQAGLQSILSSIFDLFNSPDAKAKDAYKDYLNQGAGYQNPFYNSGVGALGDYQKWLKGMSDPSKFINETMGKYESSPWNNYLQQANIRAGQNAASNEGTIGSTPFAHELQQNAQGLASSDMQRYLSSVLGVNTQYGGGLNNLIQGGQHAGDILSQLFGGSAGDMASMNYNQAGQRNKNWSNILSSLGGLFGGMFQ